MKHEILYLNSSRAYVLVNEVWYDTNKELAPEVDQFFLLGRIEKILTYEQYVVEYPESTNEIYPYVIDKTLSSGFIRKVVDKIVKYGINPIDLQVGQTQKEALQN